MNRDRIEGGWKQFSGNVREQWCKVRGDESGVNAAKYTQSAGRRQVRRGIFRQEAARQLRDCLYRNRNWDISKRGSGVRY